MTKRNRRILRTNGSTFVLPGIGRGRWEVVQHYTPKGRERKLHAVELWSQGRRFSHLEWQPDMGTEDILVALRDVSRAVQTAVQTLDKNLTPPSTE